MLLLLRRRRGACDLALLRLSFLLLLRWWRMGDLRLRSRLAALHRRALLRLLSFTALRLCLALLLLRLRTLLRYRTVLLLRTLLLLRARL